MGERCVEPLRGMFAFAIWDAPRRSLLLARDRLGIKPLYYAATPEGLLFGSELKALLQSPWLSRGLDREGLGAYLQYGYVPDPLSILDGVSEAAAGPHADGAGRSPGARLAATGSATAHFETAAGASTRRRRRRAVEPSSRTPCAPTWSATCRSARS